MNTNYSHGGRLGNCFFTGMAMHFIAKKNNLAVAYKMHHKLKNLGIDLFVGEKHMTRMFLCAIGILWS